MDNAKVKAEAEEKAATDKLMADKKAAVLGIPVIETPKPEVKIVMTSD